MRDGCVKGRTPFIHPNSFHTCLPLFAGLPDPPNPSLAAALTRAICLASRHMPDEGTLLTTTADGEAIAAEGGGRRLPRPRVLLLAATEAAADAYIPFMNACFAAQAAGIVVDACPLGGADQGLLQQAASLTGGAYCRPRRRPALLQYLMASYGWGGGGAGPVGGAGTRASRHCPFPDPPARLPAPLDRVPPPASAALHPCPPPVGGVDLRAACFCHWDPVDVGHVCSVCLSIYCTPRDECPTCGSVFGGVGAGAKRAAGGEGPQGAPAQRARAGGD